MAFPEDLLEQSHHLARSEPRRPKEASSRRAISTAYYALFHLLISETVRNWKRPTERSSLARMFEHGLMSKACKAKSDGLSAYFNASPPAGTQLDISKHLQIVTSTFVRMQQHRHMADYDNTTKWTRTEVIETIESVDAAFASWHMIRQEHLAQDFLVTLLIRERR